MGVQAYQNISSPYCDERKEKIVYICREFF